MVISNPGTRAQSQPGIEAAAVAADNTSGSYVDVAAILAGAVVAAAVSSLFLAFGAAIGLSLTAVTGVSRASVIGLAVATGLWLLWVQISSFIGGGYIAGRLRRRIGDAQQHEVELRDGAHGLIVWALGVLIATVLTSWLATSGVVTLANSAASTDYYADQLMRGDSLAATAGPGVKNAELARILTMNVAARTTSEVDTAYAVKQIAARTGLSEADAQARLESVVTSLRSQADTARRYGILMAFLTATSLLISAVATWWAAYVGGRHRDEGLDHSSYWRWR